MKNQELLFCPFCGYKAILEVSPQDDCYIICSQCLNQTNHYDTWDEAYKAWNKRSTHPIADSKVKNVNDIKWSEYPKDGILNDGDEVVFAPSKTPKCECSAKVHHVCDFCKGKEPMKESEPAEVEELAKRLQVFVIESNDLSPHPKYVNHYKVISSNRSNTIAELLVKDGYSKHPPQTLVRLDENELVHYLAVRDEDMLLRDIKSLAKDICSKFGTPAKGGLSIEDIAVMVGSVGMIGNILNQSEDQYAYLSIPACMLIASNIHAELQKRSSV